MARAQRAGGRSGGPRVGRSRSRAGSTPSRSERREHAAGREINHAARLDGGAARAYGASPAPTLPVSRRVALPAWSVRRGRGKPTKGRAGHRRRQRREGGGIGGVEQSTSLGQRTRRVT